MTAAPATAFFARKMMANPIAQMTSHAARSMVFIAGENLNIGRALLRLVQQAVVVQVVGVGGVHRKDIGRTGPGRYSIFTAGAQRASPRDRLTHA